MPSSSPVPGDPGTCPGSPLCSAPWAAYGTGHGTATCATTASRHCRGVPGTCQRHLHPARTLAWTDAAQGLVSGRPSGAGGEHPRCSRPSVLLPPAPMSAHPVVPPPPSFRPSPTVLRHCRGTRRPTAAAEAPLLPRSSLAPQAAMDTPAPRGVPRRYPCPQCLAVHTRPLRAAAGEVPHPALPGGGRLPRQGPVGAGGWGGRRDPPVATTCLGPSLPPPHPKRVRAMGVIAAAQSNKRPTPSVLQPPSLGTACPIARVLPAPWPSPVPLPAQGQSWRPQPFPPIRPVSPGPIPSCRPCMRGCVPAGAGSEGRVGGQGTPRRHLPAGRAAFVWGFFLLPQRFLIFEKCCCWVLKTDCVAPEAEILHLHGAGYCR